VSGLLQAAWLLGALACFTAIVERTRADLLAPTDVKLRLRSFGMNWFSGDFARYAYHAAPEPTRSRLRRSAWAYAMFHLCWAMGAAWIWIWLAPIGLVVAAVTVWRILSH
jgi:hypothetical protein